jgi:hypothetical protein
MALTPYTIATGYATALAAGDPVQLSSGTLVQGANNEGNLGVLHSVEYTDTAGNIHIDKYWPASTTATSINALVMDDPLATYLVKADGPIPAATVYPGLMYAMNLTAPSAVTGRSLMTVNTIPEIVGDVDISAMVDLVDAGGVPGLAGGDAFTIETTDPANTPTTITITDPMTPAALLALLNAVPGIVATIAAGTGFLTIRTSDGYYITTASTIGTPIADFFVAASHTAAGTKAVAIASAMVKVVSAPDRDNRVLEVALTLPSILADS